MTPTAILPPRASAVVGVVTAAAAISVATIGAKNLFVMIISPFRSQRLHAEITCRLWLNLRRPTDVEHEASSLKKSFYGKTRQQNAGSRVNGLALC
jgi:hypothetical protein